MSASDWDVVAGFAERMSASAQLADKVAEIDELSRPRCGSCALWMKSRRCPREVKFHGYTQGPSCNDLPCDKFEWNPSTLALISERIAEAKQFATKNGLKTILASGGEA